MKEKNRNIQITIDESLLPFVITSIGKPILINGKESFLWAAKNSTTYVVSLLIEDGIDLSKYGYEALLEAVSVGNIEVVRLLLNNGVDVTGDKNEAIVIASKNGYVEIVELLIEHGADIHSCNRKALYSSSENNHIEVVKLLIEKSCNTDDIVIALNEAILNGHAELTEYLLNLLPGNINDYTTLKCAFAKAISENYFKVVKLLVEKGFNINIVILGYTPIEHAVSNNSIECINILFKAGAIISYKNFRVLRLASKQDNIEIYNMLVKQITLK